ncbi:hypothetical protein [Microbacterium natoriense]|jgi:hypothetical protein
MHRIPVPIPIPMIDPVIPLINFVVMNEAQAALQVKLVEDAYAALGASRKALEAIAQGQTATVWTADGKSVELAAMLTARYNATLAWGAALETQLDRAKENLVLAIDSTTKFDEEAQQRYIDRLNKADADASSGATAV